jgi:hypothetical protein
MLHLGLDFQTVRVICKDCGWFRNIAHSGCADGKRALVAISRSSDPSHVLHARVVEVPEDQPLAEVLLAHPEFRDLEVEAHTNGLFHMQNSYSPLLFDQLCPRCQTAGKLELSQIHYAGQHVRY